MTTTEIVIKSAREVTRAIKVLTGIINIDAEVFKNLHESLTDLDKEQTEVIPEVGKTKEYLKSKFSKIELGVGENGDPVYMEIDNQLLYNCIDVVLLYYDQQTSPLKSEIARLKAENKELSSALIKLIEVKEWKDKYGKDEHYLRAMPIAWENARKLIQK